MSTSFFGQYGDGYGQLHFQETEPLFTVFEDFLHAPLYMHSTQQINIIRKLPKIVPYKY